VKVFSSSSPLSIIKYQGALIIPPTQLIKNPLGTEKRKTNNITYNPPLRNKLLSKTQEESRLKQRLLRHLFDSTQISNTSAKEVFHTHFPCTNLKKMVFFPQHHYLRDIFDEIVYGCCDKRP
jgi:hypothetical protein